jgi:hypothetical protein
VNADIRELNAVRELHLRRRRCGQADLRINGVHLWWSGTDERERNGVLSWIAALQMRHSIVWMRRHCVMFMGRQPVVVLWMIVIVVGVRVQR